MECQICYTKTNKNFICPYCKFEACKICWSNFFTENIQSYMKDLCCMNIQCKKEYTIKILYENFSTKFIHSYNILRGDLLYEIERSSFHRFTSIVETRKKRLELNKKKDDILYKFNDNIQKINYIFRKYKKFNNIYYPVMKEIFTYYNKKPNLNTLRDILSNYNNLEENIIKKLIIINNSYNKKNKEKIYKNNMELIRYFLPEFINEDLIDILNIREEIIDSKFIKKEIKLINRELSYLYNRYDNYSNTIVKNKNFCFTKDCTGILIDNICSACNNFCCNKCTRMTDSSIKHICNEDDIELTKFLKDSKRCPKCKEMIYKIHGCDVMWCTLCHTHFNYKTGDFIKSGSLHNPEFISYLNSIGETYQYNPLDNNNNHFLNTHYYGNRFYYVNSYFLKKNNNETILIFKNKRDCINDICFYINDFTLFNARGLDISTIDIKVNKKVSNENIILHLLGNISKDKFKKEINTIYKVRMAWSDYKIIILEFMDLLIDNYNEYLLNMDKPDLFFNFLDNNVPKYNDLLKSINKIYKIKNPIIFYNIETTNPFKFYIN